MVIVDTTVWIDFFRGVRNPETEWLDLQLGRQGMGLTDIIFCEVLQGIPDDRSFNKVLHEFSGFEIFDTGGKHLAIDAARNFRKLRQRGITIRRTIDCWIATFCIREGHALLHRDRDFDPFESVLALSVVHP